MRVCACGCGLSLEGQKSSVKYAMRRGLRIRYEKAINTLEVGG
jgi:hypothetical protein